MHSQKERAIERYIQGRMSPSEQQEFLRHAAGDPMLHRQLQAEQVITSAIDNDRAAIPAVQTMPGPRLLASLAATHPVAGTTVGESAGGNTALRFTAAAMCIIGLVVLAAILLPMLGVSFGGPASHSPAEPTAAALKASDTHGNEAHASGAFTGAAAHAGEQLACGAGIASASRRPAAASEDRSSTRESMPAAAAAPTAETRPTAPQTTPAARNAHRTEPQVFEDTTVHLRVETREKH